MADDTLVVAFLLSGAALLAVSVVVRGRLFAGGGGHHLPIDPIDVAYLKGGSGLAEYAALAALRASGALAPDGTPGPLPAGLPKLAQVAHQGIVAGSGPWQALRGPAAREAQAQIRTKLERQGLLTSRAQRTGARVGPLVLLGAAVGGVALAQASTEPRHTVIYILGAAVLGIVGVLTLRAPYRTVAGKAVLRDQTRRNGHLHPRNRPAWQTYGPAGAALSVGLFGTAAWWASDPAYARALGMSPAYVGGGSSGYSSGSSSCSSSSSDSAPGCNSSSSCNSSSCNSSSCSSSSCGSSSGSSCGSSCGGGGGGD
ncbi:TIGR04222 domain-containing membrane protein [Longispora sp. K20-0274]|uniref:TIGR04222 domain-containing membrane protein n=1 Tax=Longispora sp. K20-0274 TaxID=3088255 RepID=UPI00399ACCEA